MKKILFILCLYASYSFSQFNSSNEIPIGATQTMYQCDSASNNYASIVGNGVTWDYSNLLKVNITPKIYSVIANDDATNYPSVNKVFQIEGVLKNYIQTDANGRTQFGFKYTDPNINVATNYTGSDPMNLMTYPFALNSVLDDIFTGTITANQPVNPSITGVSKSKIDGVGTLKIYNQTFNNVTRYFLNDTVNATTFLGPVKIVVNQYEYYDLSGSFSSQYLPILNFTTIKILLAAPISIKLVLSAIDPVYFVSVNELDNNEIILAPNPVNNVINLFNLSSQTLYEIRSIDGKIVSLGNTSNSIDVSNLNKGSYILIIKENEKSKTFSFVKE